MAWGGHNGYGGGGSLIRVRGWRERRRRVLLRVGLYNSATPELEPSSQHSLPQPAVMLLRKGAPREERATLK